MGSYLQLLQACRARLEIPFRGMRCLILTEKVGSKVKWPGLQYAIDAATPHHKIDKTPRLGSKFVVTPRDRVPSGIGGTLRRPIGNIAKLSRQN